MTSHSHKKVVLLTGSELRHTFFRTYLGNQEGIEVARTYCESQKGNIVERVKKAAGENEGRSKHLSMRAQTEKDFFEVFCQEIKDQSNPVFITKGDINLPAHVEDITALDPDLIISYGCSIIRSSLLEKFAGRFINIHLGLSPYYRGSGTNFWPFVENELQFVGTTFMYIDAGVDTGEIIHQIRAAMYPGDTLHQIGNRLILHSTQTCATLIRQFDQLSPLSPISFDEEEAKYYRKKDFNEAAVDQCYQNFEQGIVDAYLKNKEKTDRAFPILSNPAMA
ncbi:MAG: formyltransferase family protein [Bacteroidota bacterium]